MTIDPRVHAGRRSRAIDRLRTMTTGAAVAGVAGTAAFGVLAATTWSGEPGATGAAAVGPSPTATAPDDASGRGSSGAEAPGNQPEPAAPGGGSTRIRPAQPGSGRGHATTGGSS
jgi:hypothetical protein